MNEVRLARLAGFWMMMGLGISLIVIGCVMVVTSN
jgi:hypothetical protein